LGGLEVEERHMPAVQAALNRAPFYNPNAPSLRLYHQWDMALHVGRGTHAGYTFWEVDALNPIEVHQLSALDLLFVPSHWAKEVAERQQVTSPICVLPCGVDADVFHSGVQRASVNGITPSTTVFLTVGKYEIRKGHMELVEAFNSAFAPEDDVALIMHCHNPLNLPGYNGPEESKKWSKMFVDSPMGKVGKIFCSSNRVRCQSELASLMALADCGVFPSKAEGWNLPLAEMLAMGKQAIATNYSAHTEFAKAGGARLIDIDGLEPAYDGFFFRGDKNWAKWGEAQKDQLVQYLRDIHAEKLHRGSVAINECGIDLFQEKLTWDNAAKIVLTALGV
jgi:glycosyltransferase involved in cell wall biosynthesis